MLFYHFITIHLIKVIVSWLLALLGIQSNEYNHITRVALKWLPSPSWSDWLIHLFGTKKNPHSTPLFPKRKSTRTWGDCMISPFQKNSQPPSPHPLLKTKNLRPLGAYWAFSLATWFFFPQLFVTIFHLG